MIWELDYKKVECQGIDAFELRCWRRLLRVSCTARGSNQSILKEISPEYLLEGLMLKLKLQYLATWCEELTHLKRPWCWERLKAGEGDDRGWDGWMTKPTRCTWIWVSSGCWWYTGKPGMVQSLGSQGVRHDWATELIDDSRAGSTIESTKKSVEYVSYCMNYCKVVHQKIVQANKLPRDQWVTLYIKRILREHRQIHLKPLKCFVIEWWNTQTSCNFP